MGNRLAIIFGRLFRTYPIRQTDLSINSVHPLDHWSIERFHGELKAEFKLQ